MREKELIKNLELNSKRFENKYNYLIDMIKKEDNESKSFYNNSFILLTIETTLIISLIINMNLKIMNEISLIISLFNFLILFAIFMGLTYFKKSLDNKDIITIKPNKELKKANIRYEDYLNQINLDYEKNNFRNRNILNDKRYNNNQGIKFLRYGIIYLTLFLIYISLNVRI